MEEETKIIFGVIAFCVILFGLFGYFLLIYDNVNEISGVKCARNSRINVDYPFCSDVLDCMEDCNTIGGGFVEAKTIGGLANSNRCFCYTNDGIRNIW